MKKIQTLLVIAVASTMSIFAEPSINLKWIASQDGMGSEIPIDIKPSYDNKAIYTLNHFESNAQENVYDKNGFIVEGYSMTTDYWFYDMVDGKATSERESKGALYTAKSVSGNHNLTLYKTALDGHLEWGVSSNIGYMYEGAMTPTIDGGVMLLLKFKHTDKGAYRSDVLCQLVDDEGNETPVMWDAPDYKTYSGVYQLVMAKVSKDGAVEWAKRIPVEYKVENGLKYYDNISIGAMTTDAAGNIYVSGTYATGVNFGRNGNFNEPNNFQTTTASGFGDLFVVKLNPKGTAVWGIETKGTSYDERSKGLEIGEDGKLYISGYVGGDGSGAAIRLGNSTTNLYPEKRDCLYYGCINPSNGNVEWVRMLKTVEHPVTQDGARIKPMCMTVTGDNIYMGGSYYGNIEDDGDAILENANGQTAGLLAFILKCNIADGAVENAVTIPGALTEVQDIIVRDNLVLAEGYALFADKSYLYVLDENLNYETMSEHIIKESRMSVTVGGVLVGDLLVSATNANQMATFPGCDWELFVMKNGQNNYRACIYTAHDISELLPTGGVAPEIVSDNFKVYTANGVVNIVTDKDTMVNIHNIAGTLVKRTYAKSGTTTLSLPTGFYIVNGHKLIVR